MLGNIQSNNNETPLTLINEMLDRISIRSKSYVEYDSIKETLSVRPYGNFIKGKLVFTKHLDFLSMC